MSSEEKCNSTEKERSPEAAENRRERIAAISAELDTCRGEGEHAMEMIILAITLGGTILGILIGSSFLADDDGNDPLFATLSFLTRNRVVFWLCCVVFVGEFNFVTIQGLYSVLRYFYMQRLRDEISAELVNSDEEDINAPFLHFEEYMAPVKTQNWKHLTSMTSGFHFLCYWGLVAMLILFSLGITLAEFVSIEPLEIYDWIVLWVMVVIMGLAAVVFVLINMRSRKMSDNTYIVATENKRLRLQGRRDDQYERSAEWRNLLWYLIYPRRADLEKAGLIIAGWLFANFMLGFPYPYGFDVVKAIIRLILILFSIDICICQARFQINDIDDIAEDLALGRKDRLALPGDNEAVIRHKVHVSVAVLIVRIIAGLIVGLFLLLANHRPQILLCGIGVLILTGLYEKARAGRYTALVYILVGGGYVLRFIAGMSALMLGRDMLAWLLTPEGILTAAVMWSYGSLSVTMAWAQGVSALMKRGWEPEKMVKPYFVAFGRRLQARFECAAGRLDNNEAGVRVLLERCSIRDPWNICLLLCLVGFVAIGFVKSAPVIPLGICIAGSAVIMGGALAGHRLAVTATGLGWLLLLLGCLMQPIFGGSYVPYVMLEGLVTGTYFYLRTRACPGTVKDKSKLGIIARIFVGTKIYEKYFKDWNFSEERDQSDLRL